MDSDDNKYCSLSFSSSFLAIRINSINSSDFIIKEGGNIGIGTTSPGSKLKFMITALLVSKRYFTC